MPLTSSTEANLSKNQHPQEPMDHLLVLQKSHNSYACAELTFIANRELPKSNLRGYTFNYEGIPVLST